MEMDDDGDEDIEDHMDNDARHADNEGRRLATVV